MTDYQQYVQESLAELTKNIRKDSRSVKNRVGSIVNDSKWVIEVGDKFGLPLIANERCGRWYIPPEKIIDSVYFKSTDGHTTQWQFSTRRLNLHILEVIKNNNGCVIVDSTRRGKRMPDALSKTIPIWCGVINKLVFNKDLFYTPPNAVSKSEHSQIEALIQQFVEQLENLELEIKLDKPLRPIWVTPDGSLPTEIPEFDEFFPVVLCTASRMVQDATEQRNGYMYVQGAADDHEEWAAKLTPDMLWQNVDKLMEFGTENEILEFIDSVSGNTTCTSTKAETQLTQIKPHNIWIGKNTIDKNEMQKFDNIIDLCENSKSPYALKSGKLGSKELREKLPKIVESVKPDSKIAVTCDSGTDLSVGVVLALICKINKICSKPEIRKQLAHIINQYKCNPSRATLNAVNSYLMG